MLAHRLAYVAPGKGISPSFSDPLPLQQSTSLHTSSRMSQAAASSLATSPSATTSTTTAVSAMGTLGSTDVFDGPEATYFKIDIPGLSKTDVRVRVSEGNLVVSGERHVDAGFADSHCVRTERFFGHFSRVFKLPAGVDASKITASCDHGVLSVSVPKPKIALAAPVPVSVTVVSAEEEGDGSLNSEFAAVPINIFPTPALGKLVIIDSNMSLIDAVKTLSQYRILAAPVRDVTKAADAPWSEKYLGIVDMTAIVFQMLEKLEPLGVAPEDFEKEMERLDEFKKTTVGDAAKWARFGPFVPIDHDRGNLLDAMLLCGNHAIRRAPVVKSPGGDITNIITQSALVQTLAANLERFGTVAKLPMAQLGLATPSQVHSVTTEDKLRVAFRLIKENDISAVPVTDPATGAIKGNISARDARLLVSSQKVYKLLNMPIRVYLDVISDGAENSAITCQPSDTLEEVIKRMVRSRIHRVYVVDSQQRIVRVVSLRNILRKFTKEPQGYFGHYFEY